MGYSIDSCVLRPVAVAQGTLSVFSASTGELILTKTLGDVRGSDASSPEEASREALTALAGKMREILVQKLSEHLRETGFQFHVKVRGPEASDGAPRVKGILESTRWVESVEVAREEAGLTVLAVASREKPYYVVEELREAEEIEVESFDAYIGLVKLR